MKINAILLAAGTSSRMKEKNKLLLPWEGKPLVVHAFEQLAKADFQEILVVTGFEAERIKSVLEGYNARFLHNPNFETGMTSSIQTGVLNCLSDTEGYLIGLSDMPFLRFKDYNVLIRKFKETVHLGARIIVATTKEGKKRNPVIFSHHYNKAILQHKAPNGCKKILLENPQHIIPVELEALGTFRDIDTQEEYLSMREEIDGELSIKNRIAS